MQSSSAINDAELRAVSKASTNGSEWRRFLIFKKVTGLTQVVAIEQGTLSDGGWAEKKAALQKLAAEIKAWDDVSDETRAMSEDELMDQITELHAQCRNRAKACMDRMNASNGLPTGGKAQVTMEPSTFWKGAAQQRGNRPVNDRDRGNDKLVQLIGDHIYDVGGRKMPAVTLDKVRSAEEQKAEMEDSGDEDDEEEKTKKKKGGKMGKVAMGKAAMLQRIFILCNTVGAVCSGHYDPLGKIEVRKGCGDVKLDGQGKTVLDCSYAESQEFANFLVLLCSSVELAKMQATFDAVWERVRTFVNENSEFGYTVASAFQLARNDSVSAKSIAGEVTQAVKVGGAKQKATPKASGGKGAAKRAAAAGKGAPSPKKSKAAKGKKHALANTSGQVCFTYHSTGKCDYNEKCKHKHVPPGEETDGEDDRE